MSLKMASHIKRRLPLLTFLFLSLLLLTSCHVFRYVWWNYAGADDYLKFPADSVQRGSLIRTIPDNQLRQAPLLPLSFGSETIQTLHEFLKSSHTLAFLILRNDSLIFEEYENGKDRNSVVTSFSVAKSFVGALVGIALQEGAIGSLNDPVSKYLPEMKDPRFSSVTIGDLLTMRSGVKFREGYSDPFGGMAKFYYGRNLKRYTLKLRVKDTPGEKYEYISGNAQILAMALERATGKRLSAYLEEKIWKPAGMAYPAFWSLDSKQNAEPKAFCCLNARAIDFARFGQLFLNDGKAGELSVIPSEWIQGTFQLKNDSRDSQGYPYTYAWRVTPEGNLFAKGILGQYIFVCPSKRIVIVRFGEKSGEIVWPEFFRQLSEQF